MQTDSFWEKTKPPADDEPEIAKATIQLFEKYGLDVPKAEWDRALRGATNVDEKVICTDDLDDDDLPEPAKHDRKDWILITGKVTDVLLAVDRDTLLTLDRYHFAPVQSKTAAVDRKLKASRNLGKESFNRILAYYFYKPTLNDLPDEFEVYNNQELKCAIAIYCPTNNYWFLQP
jgi:hypothetical protein